MRRFPGRDVPSLLWPLWPQQHQLQHRSPQAGNHCPEDLLHWWYPDSCQPAGGQNFHNFWFLSYSDLPANRQQSVKTQQPYLDLLLKQPLENKKLKVNPFIAVPSLVFHILTFSDFFEVPTEVLLSCHSRFSSCLFSPPPFYPLL